MEIQKKKSKTYLYPTIGGNQFGEEVDKLLTEGVGNLRVHKLVGSYLELSKTVKV